MSNAHKVNSAADSLASMMARRSQQTITPEPPAAITAIRPPRPAQIVAAATDPKSPLSAWFQSLSTAVSTYRGSMLEIIYYARLIRDVDGWVELGFESEDHARASLGISIGSWNEFVTLGDRLSHLTLDQTKQLTASAARLLTRVNPKIWDDYAWVEEAIALPARDLQILVDSRNSQISPTALVEPKARVQVQVPISQRKQLERRLEMIRRHNRLSSHAAALDYSLKAAESQAQVASTITAMSDSLTSLMALWSTDMPWSESMTESEDELNARLDGNKAPANLTEAAHLSSRLVRKLVTRIKELNQYAALSNSRNPRSLPDSTSKGSEV